MKISEVFTSKFLRAADIDRIANADGTALVTIDRVEMVEIGQDQQEKPVVYFRDIDPGLVLNKTNAATLVGLIGNDTEEWEGKTVGLFTTEVDFQGKQTLAIRVRMRLPKQRAAKPAEVDETIGF
jgi:hypothetical protein